MDNNVKSFTINGILMDLNTYINIERGNRYAAAKAKEEMTSLSCVFAKKLEPVAEKSKIILTWYCQNEKKDPDNIAFAKKFILDGMKNAGVIKDDSWKYIAGFEDKFEVDKENPRILVEIQPV